MASPVTKHEDFLLDLQMETEERESDARQIASEKSDFDSLKLDELLLSDSPESMTNSSSLEEILQNKKGLSFLGQSDLTTTHDDVRGPTVLDPQEVLPSPGNQQNYQNKVSTKLKIPTRSSPRLQNNKSKRQNMPNNSNNEASQPPGNQQAQQPDQLPHQTPSYSKASKSILESESHSTFTTPAQSQTMIHTSMSDTKILPKRSKRLRSDVSPDLSPTASAMLYIDKVAEQLNSKTTAETNSNQTEIKITDNEESLVSRFVSMSVQTSNSILSTSPDKKLTVSFQENDHPISQAALKWWRSARTAGTHRIEYSIRSRHLNMLDKADIYPPWALGLEPMPGYLRSHRDELVSQLRLHAKETMRLASEILMRKASEQMQEYRGHLTTVTNIYGSDVKGLERALGALRKALTKSGRQTREKLDSRRKFLESRRVSDRTLLSKIGLGDNTPTSSSRDPDTTKNNNPAERSQPRKQSGYKRARSRSPANNRRNDRTRSSPAPKSRKQNRANPQPRGRTQPTLTMAEMAVLQNILKKHGQ
jgi:hypothetical protein